MNETILVDRGGDGATRAMTPEEYTTLKNEVLAIRQFGTQLISRRQLTERIRYCRWPGQSPDGRKWSEYLGDDALPFDGAMDSRVRTADKIINRHVAQIVSAVMKATPKVSGIEGNDAVTAGKIKTLLSWLKSNQWGAEFRRQIELLGQYQEGDGYAICMVDWTKRQAIELKEVDADSLAIMLLQLAQVDLNDKQAATNVLLEINNIIADQARSSELVVLLAAAFPKLSSSRCKKLAGEIYATGKGKFPAPYDKINIPEISAKRVYNDVFFPENSADLQRSTRVELREWLTEAEVRERAATQEWPKELRDVLLANEGKSGFEEWDQLRLTRSTDYNQVNIRRGMFEVITDFCQACNEDGISGIYVTVFSSFCDKPFTDSQLWDRKHGQYPFVWFGREFCTNLLLDSRSIPEVVVTDQNEEKMFHDSFSDHVTFTINPTLLVAPGSPKYNATLQPFGQMEYSIRGKPEFLSRPTYPQAADKMWFETRRNTAEYFGYPMEGIDKETIQLLAQDRIDRFLSSVAEIMKMTLMLCQQYMPDAMIQRIVGGNGVSIAKTREEIQGQFDVTYCYDWRDNDPEYITAKAKIIKDLVMPMATDGRVKFSMAAQRIIEALDPNWAEQMIVPEEAATEAEVSAAKAAFVSCCNGTRPSMPEGGINAKLRLQVFTAEVQQRQGNPAAYGPMTPAAQMMVQEYSKYLTFQSQQQDNKQIGRTGVDPAKTDQKIADMQGGTMGAERGAMQ